MSQLRKVTMNLTERDVRNTEKLTEQLHTRRIEKVIIPGLTEKE
jgi:hypothetical protein